MKKLLFVGIGSALMFTMGGVGPASADNGVHISTAATAAGDVTVNTAAGAGRCAGCHRTHTAKASMLLKEAQPALCYTCHGGGAGANTDVQNGTSGVGGALRGGGFEYALLGSDAASKTMALPVAPSTRWGTSNQTVPVGESEATTSKHQIDGVASGTMWGNGAISDSVNVGKAAVTLECGSCHDPHGNGNYRILKPVPDGAAYVVTPAVVADPLAVPPVLAAAAVMSTTGVIIPDVPAELVTPGSHVYTTTNYWSVVDRKAPVTKGGAAITDALVTDGYIANVSQWCSTCHSRYMAKAPDYSTDSGDAVFTYRHTSGKTDKGGVSRPNCIQCHVSHGSNATVATGLNPGDTASAVGDSKLLRVDQRGTCVMCHNV